MIASLLKYRIEIKQVSTTRDTTGDSVRTETTYKNAWAGVKYDTGAESTTTDQRTAEVKVRFQIRYDANITDTMIVIHNGESYDIKFIEKINRDTLFLHGARINKR